MNVKLLLAILIFGLIAGCATDEPSLPAETVAETQVTRQYRVTATDEHCFNRGTMYSEGAASCQSGIEYRCNNGEWRSLGNSCMDDTVALSKPCQYSGVTFPTGAASCQAGTQYRCEDGVWRQLNMACSELSSPVRLVPGGRTCMFDDVTVATSSTICRAGTTFLCSDGEWVNLGTLCR